MIRIDINDAAVSAALARLSARVTDLAEPLGDIGEMMVASTQDRMSKGLTPEGTPFAPRSPTTVAIYDAKGLRYGKPLNQSGVLRGSIFYQVTGDGVRIGTNAIQSAVMQLGAAKHSLGPRSPWGPIPPRPYLGISEADRAGIGEIVEEWLAGAIAAEE